MGAVRLPAASEQIEEALQCVSDGCNGLFIAKYTKRGDGSYGLVRTFPVEFVAPIIPDLLKQLSPMFFETYTQALHAESLGLNHLTGIGMRKALEFLIKDFALGQAPTEEEKAKIRKKMLGPCIQDHIVDPSVQNVAQRCAWLGNDETHYERRWVDKDIEDLKTLLRLTMNRVDSALLERKYLLEMLDPGATP